MPRLEVLDEVQLRHFQAKRWAGAHGLLRAAPYHQTRLYLVTWESSTVQLSMHEWPAHARQRGAEGLKDAQPVTSAEELHEGHALCMAIKDHLATQGIHLSRMSLLADRGTSEELKVLAATHLKTVVE